MAAPFADAGTAPDRTGRLADGNAVVSGEYRSNVFYAFAEIVARQAPVAAAGRRRRIIMLIDPGTIAGRFEENLEWANRLDLVSAWATEHDGLRLLEERANQGLQVRAIVGLWNYITEPEALRRLDRLGKLRLAGGGRRFHPKVYLFLGQGRTSAWIGSANFTAGGFAINEEAVFESGDAESVTSWFKNLWRECGPLDENAIDEYEQARKKNPPPRQPLAGTRGSNDGPHDTAPTSDRLGQLCRGLA